MRNTWTEHELQFIRDNYETMTDKEISDYFGTHSEISVATKRKRMHLLHTNSKYTFEDVKLEFEKTNYILLSDASEYINAGVNSLRYLCPKHVDKGEQTISLGHLQSGRGCYYCGRDITEESRRLSDEDVKTSCRELCTKKGFIYHGFSRRDGLIYVLFICPNHIEAGIQEMRKGNMERENIIGCRYCFDTKKFKFSKGEKAIAEILDQFNIVYLQQHCFADCKDINMLPFDYYLPEYNACIEFDGQHHYMPINFNGISDEEAYANHLSTKRHDEIKNKYCTQNNINLLRIPYYNFKEIDNLVLSFLNIENIA